MNLLAQNGGMPFAGIQPRKHLLGQAIKDKLSDGNGSRIGSGGSLLGRDKDHDPLRDRFGLHDRKADRREKLVSTLKQDAPQIKSKIQNLVSNLPPNAQNKLDSIKSKVQSFKGSLPQPGQGILGRIDAFKANQGVNFMA